MTDQKQVDLSKLKTPDYRGSVQNLYYLKKEEDVMVCETTSSGSVFDVGSIFSIPGSDLCRTAFRHAIYTRLHAPETWQAVGQTLQAEYGKREGLMNFLGTKPMGKIKPADDKQKKEDGLLAQFQSKGAPTHHLGMIDQTTGMVFKETFPSQISPFVLVEKFKIIKPTQVSYQSNHCWDYTPYKNQTGHVIPLENIVRFGITPSSSVYRKFLHLEEKQRRAFLKELGVDELPLWRSLPVPITDFTSKYEPDDRPLTCQEALLISGCSGEKFLEIIQMTLLGSLLVKQFFREMDLTLWDLKWEMAQKNDQLLFVDTIDTDSLRVTCTVTEDDGEMFVHFNKQSMRDYYKIMHSEWFEAVNLAKAAAVTHGVPFQEILKEGQKNGKYPKTPDVQEAFLKIQEKKFSVLLAQVLTPPHSDDTPSARLSRADQIQAIAREEVAFYKEAGVIHSFLAINGLRR